MASRDDGAVMTTMTMERGKGLFPKEELEVVYNASTPLILIDWSSATTSNICPTIYWWRDIHERHTRVISLAFAFRSCLFIYGNTGTGLLWTYLISFIFFTQRNLRPRNFTLESLLICDKICPATKLCTKFYTLCHILHCIAIFSCSNWKILHLAKISTQPAVVLVVTNIKCAFGLSFVFFIASF